MVTLTKRDHDICQRVATGEPVAQIAATYGIDPHRVYQILKEQGHRLPRRSATRLSGRSAYLGGFVSTAVDASVRHEAKTRGISLSQVTDETLAQELLP